MFVKYQHIERFGTMETDGIEIGTVYVFPKIDGTNASLWFDDGVQCGSRRRHLSLDDDNAGFCEFATNDTRFKSLFEKYPTIRLYGEWLVPHTLKTYIESAWREFYVFDVMVGETLIPYNEYEEILSEFGIEYIMPMRIYENPTEDHFVKCLDMNTYLIKDGDGVGEGIVIKNYAYRNRFGRQTWAKMVRNEFKVKHGKAMGISVSPTKSLVEESIVNEYQTKAIVDKVFANICNECDGWSSKFIPRLLSTVFYDLVKEDCWNFVKKFKNPKVDFGRLQKLSYAKTKEMMPELF